MNSDDDNVFELTLATREHALAIAPAFVPATGGVFGSQLVGTLIFTSGLAGRWSVHRAGEAPEMALAKEQLSLLVSMRHIHVHDASPPPSARREAPALIRVETARDDRTIREPAASQAERGPALSVMPRAHERMAPVKADGDAFTRSAPVASPSPSAAQTVPAVPQPRAQLAPARRASGAAFEDVPRVHQRVVIREVLEQFRVRVDEVVTRSQQQELLPPEVGSGRRISAEKTVASVDEVATKAVDVIERRLRAARERRGRF